MLPLMARGELLGAMLVAHQADREIATDQEFDQQTLSILLGIAHQTSIAIENIRLLEARQEEAYVTAVLLQVAQAVVSQNELGDILETIVHLLPILVGIDTCVIYLYDQSEQTFQPTHAFAGSHQKENAFLAKGYRVGEYGLLDSVAQTDQSAFCIMPDPDIDPIHWNELTCLEPGINPDFTGQENSSYLTAFPLSVKGEMFGVLLTREANVPVAFHDRRMEIISGVSQQVALAFQNERLKEDMVGRERMERDLQLARQIQKTFLPSHLPEAHGWEIDVRWETAREVGGDFYDVFKVGKNKIALVIADVSDKGMPAALYMTVTRTLIRSVAQTESSPARVLSKVNHLLMLDEQDTMFVTAIYALLDLNTHQMLYANAGHNRPLIYRNETNEIETLPQGGIAMGVLNEIKLQNHQIAIQGGDMLIFYTDGLTESFSIDGKTYGEERLLETLKNNQCNSVCQLLEAIESSVKEFRNGEPPSDDLTMVALHRLAPEQQSC
jgi:serine phosphatase RsbU (regulator of sigma subunit)